MTDSKRFSGDFMQEYARSLSNYHRDNFDYHVLKKTLRREVLALVSYWLHKCLKRDLVDIRDWPAVEAYGQLWGLLADDESRALLIKLLCYRRSEEHTSELQS